MFHTITREDYSLDALASTIAKFENKFNLSKEQLNSFKDWLRNVSGMAEARQEMSDDLFESQAFGTYAPLKMAGANKASEALCKIFKVYDYAIDNIDSSASAEDLIKLLEDLI